MIPTVALTRGFPLSVRLVRNPETVSVMTDGSLLRSGGETCGPVWPDNVQETGVWPVGQCGFPVVAARGGPGRANSKKELVTDPI
jgi:hypothetical protein